MNKKLATALLKYSPKTVILQPCCVKKQQKNIKATFEYN